MPSLDLPSLRQHLASNRRRQGHLHGRHGSVALAELGSASALDGELDKLRGRSVLLATADQLATALALVDLDGLAGRIVLCPTGLAVEHLPAIAAAAQIDAVVADPERLGTLDLDADRFVVKRPGTPLPASARRPTERTEWVLLTSGTTGIPKLVVHTLATLTGAIAGVRPGPRITWATFYDIRRYGGLQMLLRALLAGVSMVLSSQDEPVAEFLARLARHRVTHLSGTPSHWRRATMSAAARIISPRYVRLSGEIADQAILDHLKRTYPEAAVAHAFASTEAGVAFEVRDGLAGFPESLAVGGGDVELRLCGGSLRIRSNRTALGYLRGSVTPLTDPEGFVDTGDTVELRDGRYHFTGRRDGIINVGGQKVHPEEVEAVINGHPDVRMSLVRGLRNPITGALVTADIVATDADRTTLTEEVLRHCKNHLAPYKIPATIRLVERLEVGAAGKLVRPRAQLERALSQT